MEISNTHIPRRFTLSPRHLLQDLFEDATSLYGHTPQLYRLFAGTFSSGGWGSGLIFRMDQTVEGGKILLDVHLGASLKWKQDS